MFKKILPAVSLPVQVMYLAGLCALGAMPFWPRELWWLADLICFAPLWVLFVPTAFFAASAVVRRGWGQIVLSAVSAAMICFGIMGFNVPLRSGSVSAVAPAVALKVMTVNLGGVRDPGALWRMISDENPDLIAFQELYPAIEKGLRPLLEQGGWELKTRGYLGLASRFRIRSIDVTPRWPLGWRGNILARYALETPGGLMNIVDVHLETPRHGVEAFLGRHTDAIPEMEKIKDLQEQESLRASMTAYPLQGVIVAGDFNLTRSNPLFMSYWSGYTDAFVQKGTGFGYTKHTRWHGARIDHILLDDGWQAVDAKVGEDIGGDHHPVIARLVHAGLLPRAPEAPARPEAGDSTPAADMSSGAAFREWGLEAFPMVRFAYTIPPGVPVMMRVKTSWGDWICLGGTAAGQCPGAVVRDKVAFADDGRRHEVTVNARAAVQRLLPGVKVLTELRFCDPRAEGVLIEDLKLMPETK